MPLRRLLSAAVCLLFVLACHAPVREPGLDIVFIAVGNGYATLIRTSDHRTVLIDGGPTYAGANIIYPLLNSLGIRELDYTIATNYTPERIGGLDEVIRILGGEEGVLFDCLDRGNFVGSPEFQEYREVTGSRRRRFQLGRSITLGELNISCVAANGRLLGGEQARPVVEEDRSLALLISWQDFELLLTGDLAAGPAPQADAATGLGRPPLAATLAEISGTVEMLGVSSREGTAIVTSRMVRDLDPQAVIVTGGDSLTGHPDQNSINRLTRKDRRVYQVARTGTSLIPAGRGRVVGGNVWVRVTGEYYTVAGDSFSLQPRRRPRARR